MNKGACKICNKEIKIDKRLEKEAREECLCIECMSKECYCAGETYNVSTHTARHCNTIRPPIRKMLPNGETVCICYSHWKHYYTKRCIKCKSRNGCQVKVRIDGLPYCERCKIDDTEHCKTVSNILNKYIVNDVSQEIVKRIRVK